ncbi:c-type cytochrome [Shewanella woodyi]|uniref:c-type cytochrome n=1 Tax=Shewanella woodyi TaxID=60961 RepID=UPI000B233E37|nr:c-type cytochrome [Shewanella woodyi]
MKISNVFILIAYLLLTSSMTIEAKNLDSGAEIYSDRCVLCHGNKGMGDGYIPMRLKGYPQTSLFESPKATDKTALVKVISKGVLIDTVNEYMPPWESELTEEQISDLADFVIYLRSDTENALIMLEKHTRNLDKTVRDGRVIFETRCALCHGKLGLGDGRMARIIKNPPPADLTKSILTPHQMGLIIKLGGQEVGRSPKMPPWGDFMTDNEVNAVVDFIDTLKD